MAAPALAAGLVAGGASAALNIGGARKRKKKNARLIREGYHKARTNLGTGQMDIRQAMNESLIARGIMNAGAVQETPAPESLDAIVADTTGRARNNAERKWAIGERNRRGEASVKATDQAAARKGAGGARNTYAGGVNTQLSTEFDKEFEDLAFHARAGMDANDAQGANDILGAIVGGVQMGAGVYNIASSFGGDAGSGTSKFKGAFGIDVVDPLEGINFGFNVGNV